MGHTLTLELPEEVYQSLLQTAAQAGEPPEAVAVQLLTTATQRRAEDPLEPFIGAFNSEGSDWADRHDAYLGKAVRDTMHGEEREGQPDA